MKILIASTSQFGYLIDYYRYYGYLKNKGHDVKYISWDYGKEKVENNNPDIIYVSRSGSKPARLYRFIKAIIDYEKKMKFDRIMVSCFKLVPSLLLSIPNKKMYLDIRQVAVNDEKYKRTFYDGMMRFAAKRFKNTSIITDLAAQHIGITRYNLLPLGGAYFPKSSPDDSSLDQYREIFKNDDFIFLYVGTLHKRRMVETAIGFHEFLKKHPGAKAKYLIVGDGYGEDLNNLRKYINDNNLGQYIYSIGYVVQQKLPIFFENADCGVTYFPLTPFNDVQPSTKTYEYLINGIPVIATSTKDNVKLLTQPGPPCGVVIKDTAEDFERSIGEILANRNIYDKAAIAEKFSEYEWDRLFVRYLDDVLDLPKQKQAQAI